MKQNILNKYRLVQLIVHRLSLTNAKTFNVEMESTDTWWEDSACSSPKLTGINKFHVEGDCHLESNIEAIKVYQCLSKLSRRFASYESSKPHEYNLNNIRDMKNSEATKQSMLPDTSTCVADHNEGLSKDSVTNYVTKSDEKSEPISCDRARAEAVHAPRDREPSRINSLQENVELVSERQGN